MGLLPAELQIHPEVPDAHDEDRDKISEVHVQMEKRDLGLKETHIKTNSCDADQIENDKTPDTRKSAGLLGRDVTKCPHVIPYEVVDYRGFGGKGLAKGKRPSKGACVGQEEQDTHIDQDTAPTHKSEPYELA